MNKPVFELLDLSPIEDSITYNFESKLNMPLNSTFIFNDKSYLSFNLRKSYCFDDSLQHGQLLYCLSLSGGLNYLNPNSVNFSVTQQGLCFEPIGGNSTTSLITLCFEQSDTDNFDVLIRTGIKGKNYRLMSSKDKSSQWFATDFQFLKNFSEFLPQLEDLYREFFSNSALKVLKGKIDQDIGRSEFNHQLFSSMAYKKLSALGLEN